MPEKNSLKKAHELPYRPNVGVMVLNSSGQVWLGRRLSEGNTESDGSPQLWQMPQGGIDPGETPLEAAKRELYEETGIKTATLIGESGGWINYDLPEHLIGIGLRGLYRGQTQKWFVFRFEGDDSEIAIDPPPDGHMQEFDAWQWSDIDAIPGLIVEFKRAVYDQVVTEFRHLAKTNS
ncbi:RNA pyrophosphohydrolase [Martelella mediterranea]|uniref:RNA pyrophosphohydrolase n=1 Tax=Martelella mediterranea TaxID=293089 RepID=A0A4R3NTM1_9HYPH|nr:RNA pyrophosphohydrolase [Martelella mediterranea]TCT40256.1 putative (di)nucleoside polyphosphate hydrolase [Martelella mediterranea]